MRSTNENHALNNLDKNQEANIKVNVQETPNGTLTESTDDPQHKNEGIDEEKNKESNISDEQKNKESDISDEQKRILNKYPSFAPYLIVGGGTAAMSAFKSIRANDPKAKVNLFSMIV